MSQNPATQLQINPESKKDLLVVKQPNQPQVMQSFHVQGCHYDFKLPGKYNK